MTNLTPPDNGASVAGIFGIAGNPAAAWLLGRGHGELLALRPDELQKPLKAPRCPSPTTRAVNLKTQSYYDVDEPCPFTMLYRPDGWACYHHDTPIRLPLGMRLQEAPRYEGSLASLLRLASKTVDVEYSKAVGEKRASWKWVVWE